MRQTPRQLQMRSTTRLPASSKENRPPHSPRPWCRTPCHAVRAAPSRRPPNPPVLPRFRHTSRPVQKFRPAATGSAFQCRATTLPLLPVRTRLEALSARSAHDRSTIRLCTPTQRRKHCAAYTKSPPDSPPWPFRIPRPAFLSHTKSAAYAKNLPLRKFPPPPKIAGTPPAALANPARKIFSLFSPLAVPAPAPKNTELQPFPAATSTKKLSGTNGWSPGESTGQSTAQG